jgi:hypothetical protein
VVRAFGSALADAQRACQAETMKPSESLSNALYADQTRLAERELSAFIAAVTELFGPDQARRSAEDWLEASELIENPSRYEVRNWRAVTIAASARLASRVNATPTHEFAPHIDS